MTNLNLNLTATQITSAQSSGKSETVAVVVFAHMNGVTVKAAECRRRCVPEFEPVEATIARAMREAAAWLEGGRVDLVKQPGCRYAIRTPITA